MVPYGLLTALQSFPHHCPSAGQSHFPHPELPWVQYTFSDSCKVFEEFSQHDAPVICHAAGFIQPFVLQGKPYNGGVTCRASQCVQPMAYGVSQAETCGVPETAWQQAVPTLQEYLA